MDNNSFRERLVGWYSTNKRDLPWRNTKDPYKIWLSEIILQQTRVNQGLPYYLKFVAHFPTINDLAASNVDQVLLLWQGLGYYSRGRNLHKCAQQIVNEFGGHFPADFQKLKSLKGIGDYTAAAVASFAFDLPHAVVDGNVKRVLARFYGIKADLSSAKASKVFGETANDLISHKDPATFNQAMMEFGALQCTPKKPNCMFCPMSTDCFARKNGLVGELPFKSKKAKVKTVYFTYLVFHSEENIWIKKRPSGNIWEGLHDFHLKEQSEKTERSQDGLELLLTTIGLKVNDVLIGTPSVIFTHKLTHRLIHAEFIPIQIISENALNLLRNQGDLFPVLIKDLDKYAKPVLISNYLKQERLFTKLE